MLLANFSVGIRLVEQILAARRFQLANPSVRLTHVPACLSATVRSVCHISRESIGTFVVLTGRVARLGAVRAAERSRAIMCAACGQQIIVMSRLNLGGRVDFGSKGERQACACGCLQFSELNGSVGMMDY